MTDIGNLHKYPGTNWQWFLASLEIVGFLFYNMKLILVEWMLTAVRRIKYCPIGWWCLWFKMRCFPRFLITVIRFRYLVKIVLLCSVVVWSVRLAANLQARVWILPGQLARSSLSFSFFPVEFVDKKIILLTLGKVSYRNTVTTPPLCLWVMDSYPPHVKGQRDRDEHQGRPQLYLYPLAAWRMEVIIQHIE